MNPFTDKKYNIYESPLWTSCANSGLSSRIVAQDGSPPENLNSYTTVIESKDLFYIEQYLRNEFIKFITNVYLVKRCDTYGFAMNANKTINFPRECSKTFSNFSYDKINPIRQSIKNRSGNYYSQLNTGASIFNNISYTDAYINAKKTDNDKKQLCQRFKDINSMLDDFRAILTKLNTDDVKKQYKNEYDTIMKKHAENEELRNDLNQKIDDLYNEQVSKLGNSKLYLDSTVYTSVLWTILATTLLYYIFKKQ